MQDRPDARELLDAVRGFLEEQVVPALAGTTQFHARVAANVLAIVGRELVSGEALLREEWRRLVALLEVTPATVPATGSALAEAVGALNGALATRIRAGDAEREPWHGQVLAHLRTTAEDRLVIANPRYLIPRAPE